MLIKAPFHNGVGEREARKGHATSDWNYTTGHLLRFASLPCCALTKMPGPFDIFFDSSLQSWTYKVHQDDTKNLEATPGAELRSEHISTSSHFD